jgi:hypothetical protein
VTRVESRSRVTRLGLCQGSAEEHAPFPRPPAGHSRPATAAAASQVVASGSRTLITSSTGPTGARQRFRTSYCCAVGIIEECTKTAGRSASTRSARWCSSRRAGRLWVRFRERVTTAQNRRPRRRNGCWDAVATGVSRLDPPAVRRAGIVTATSRGLSRLRRGRLSKLKAMIGLDQHPEEATHRS